MRSTRQSGAAGGFGGGLAGGLDWLVCWVVVLAGLVGCRGWTGCRVGWFGELAGWAVRAGGPGAGRQAAENVGWAGWLAAILGLVGLVGLAC